jgi:hypothetical protein
MTFLAEFWSYLRARKKLWMLPILIAMLLLGVLLVVAENTAIAPFIYTLF